jgi:tRNA A-37 threonylcarbamoyl transferase component Bud32
VTAEAQRRVAGRYRLLETIGRGGMGVVWLAHDDLLDRPVAVKEVIHRAMSDEERVAFNRRTIREARAAGRLDHPSVVVVHDVIEEDGRPWIVMQLVRSRSLGEVVRTGGPLDPRAVAEIGTQVLDALRAAHASGVLHRDVKPENVLLTEGGRVVLTDFGIATMPEETALTTTGNLSGTPAFMAPERLQGRPAAPESDLWSLGATLYAAVEGRPPFDRGAPVPTMAAVLNDRPDPAKLAGPLAPVIEGLLRKQPEQRMPAAAAAEALRRVAAGEAARAPRGRPARQPATTSTARQPPWSTFERAPAGWSRPSRSRVVLLAGLPLLLVVAGVTGWYGYRRLAGPVPTGSPSATSSAAVPGATASPSRGTAAPRPTTVPVGWQAHADPLGFTISLPPGWAEFQRQKTSVKFRLPGSQTYLLVDMTPWSDSDPLAALRGVENESVAKGKLPGYRLRTIMSRTFRGRPSADWEFTWQMTIGRAHVLDRAFTTADGRQVAVYLHTTEADWKDKSPYFDRFAKTFGVS